MFRCFRLTKSTWYYDTWLSLLKGQENLWKGQRLSGWITNLATSALTIISEKYLFIIL